MHKIMISTLGAILALAGIAGSAYAANFTDTSVGISINIDDALKKQAPSRGMQSFVSKDMSGSIVIKRVHDLSVVDFTDEMRRGGYADNSHQVMLTISGKPIEAKVEKGRGMLIPVSGQISGHQIKGVIGAYSGQDFQGFLVIATTKADDWAEWQPRMKAMFESISFVGVDKMGIVRKWENMLGGKKLQHKQENVTATTPPGVPPGMPAMYPGMPGMYGAAETVQDYDLCSDGTVKRKSTQVEQAAAQNMMVYGRSMNQGEGRWYVTVTMGAPFLVVRNGSEEGHSLEIDGKNLLLDGRTYTVTASDLCK